MTNIEKYNEAFKTVFNVEGDALRDLEYKQSAGWNSMAQIALISQLETVFGLDFNMDDIYDFKSYETGKSLLRQRFGIEL